MSEKNKSIERLLTGINNYITYGYVDSMSFNEASDDLFDYLSELTSLDSKKAFFYYKKILTDKNINDDFLKSLCLNRLLLSEFEWSYAFEFLNKNAHELSIPCLEKALFYFYCAKNDPASHPIPDRLIDKLIARYQEVKNDPNADFYHLSESFDNFSRAYGV
ncbi:MULTISPECIES: hypothetical protein [Providencia]|uniref:hypothetical protein n=1 Tax=Providencia TaxID=586 RepID=UPI0013745FF4|nr:MULTISPECIES: hypothetical protein [Providencia]EIU9514674.1 hypothetical protein [Providencia rettgeri]ELH9583367.1 hypothetical protein [Providencia rettgeri]ELM3938190.1 hypothetical protein [Providencia rettgeri]ELR5057032.1 hypothetical protein [Providencia rettgeri]ELR5085928.1 hypothetical protein [Providencia rettgeri]